MWWERFKVSKLWILCESVMKVYTSLNKNGSVNKIPNNNIVSQRRDTHSVGEYTEIQSKQGLNNEI